MNRLIILITITLLITTVWDVTLINNCVRYGKNQNNNVICLQCKETMGLGPTGSCEICKNGYQVVNGKCIMASQNTKRLLQQISFQAVGTNQIAFIPSFSSTVQSSFSVTPTTTETFEITPVNNLSTVASSNNYNSGWSSSSNFGFITQDNNNSFSFSPQSAAQATTPTLPSSILVSSQSSSQAVSPQYNTNSPSSSSQYTNQLTKTQVVSQNDNSQNYIPVTQTQYDSWASNQNSQASSHSNDEANSWFANDYSDDDSFTSFGSANSINQVTSQTTTQSFLPVGSSSSNSNPLQINQTTQVSNTSSNISANTTTQQFPQYPYCIDYSDGQCWACVPGYLLNLIIQQCMPYVKPNITITSSSNDINPASIANENKGPESNCNVFSQEKKICQECVRNYYFDINLQLCQPVDSLCRTYDPDTGKCTSCYVKYSLNPNGKCLLSS